MRLWLAVGLLASAALGALPAGAGAGGAQPIGSGEGGVALNQLGTFAEPVHVAGARGYRRLLFVVERAGVIRVLHRGRALARPFLDISGLTTCAGSCDNEQGLLSVAFPPDYRETRRFYVYYTDREGSIQIDEFRRSRQRATLAVATSRRAVLTIPHPQFGNHNGGQLQFQGHLLYFGTGDGGSGGDPPNNAQNPESLLGKLLRIDPGRSPRGAPYRIPPSNPFVGEPGRDEIFSTGLRNPYRFSIQSLRRAPDRIVIGDVGQNRFEEIDYETIPVANGANFGWDAWEGVASYDCGRQCRNGGTPDPGGTQFPIHTYGREGGCAVTGGYVVRDRSLRSLYRRYVYADYCRGQLRSLIPRLAGAADDKPLGPTVSQTSSFGETPDGRLIVASLLGPVYRIAPSR